LGKGKRKGREEGREGKGGEGEFASLALGGIDAPGGPWMARPKAARPKNWASRPKILP